jgi:HEAT repeat protein
MDQARQMNKRKRIILISVLGFGLVMIAIFALAPSEPVYQGKTVTRWIKEFNDYAGLMGGSYSLQRSGRVFNGVQYQKVDDPPAKALRALGPQAVPYLVKALKTKEASLGKIYLRVFQKTPPVVRRFLPTPSYPIQIRMGATHALACMGEAGKIAIPALIQAASEESRPGAGRVLFQSYLVAMSNLDATTNQIGALLQDLSRASRYADVLYAIKLMRVKGPTAALALASVLESKDAKLRQDALMALHEMASDGKAAAPALVNALNADDNLVRDAASWALKAIDREAAEKAGLK